MLKYKSVRERDRGTSVSYEELLLSPQYEYREIERKKRTWSWMRGSRTNLIVAA